jgi:large repetitive protein
MMHALHTQRRLSTKPGRGASLNLAHPLARGVVGYWLMAEGTGLRVTDRSRRANDGVFAGSPLPIWAAGRYGWTVDIEGGTSEVTIPHAAYLNAYPITVSVWFSATSAGVNNALVNKYVGGSFNGYQIFWGDTVTLCAWYFRDGSNQVWDQGATPLGVTGLLDGAWHHSVLTVNEAGGKHYVDGTLRASRIWSPGSGGPCTTTENIHIGRYTASFGGKIDNVSIYDRALSATEIAWLYAEPFAAFDRRSYLTSLSPRYLRVPVAPTFSSLAPSATRTELREIRP